ncbi:hypothetical protein ACFE04_015811 [Oxalis oulophora]
MDESWRMRMGMGIPYTQQRRSIESSSPTIRPMRRISNVDKAVDPDDFHDVFGGPPRTLLLRKFSSDFNFYQEIFRPPDFQPPVDGGRSLPAFRIPSRKYGSDNVAMPDTYEVDSGSYGGGWMQSQLSKSKSMSSRVSNLEDMSPLRPVSGDDLGFSSFTSKLRPLNIPRRWDSAPILMSNKQARKPTTPMPSFTSPSPPSFVDNHFVDSDFNTTSYCTFPQHVYSSPETITLEPNSYRSTKISADDDHLELFNSPLTPGDSTFYQEQETKVSSDLETDYEDDEVMSSYVIEITSDYKDGTGEEVSIDEAIAFAKEKYKTTSSFDGRQPGKEHSDESEERSNIHEFFDQQDDGCGMIHSPMEQEHENWVSEEENEQAEPKIRMDMLNEDIQLWLAGKENNIRSLLSTLDHVLWPNCGWYPIPLTSLIQSTQVKNAYQKARLCLHPEKLKKGATFSHKYVAEKVFTILQSSVSTGKLATNSDSRLQQIYDH